MKKVYVGMAGIIQKADQFLILKRSPDKDFTPSTWEPVTGRLESDEDPKVGIIREIEEEANLKAEVLMPIETGFFYRGGKEFPMVFIIYWCKYLDGEVKLSWEHTEYKWLTLEEILAEPNMELFHPAYKKISQFQKSLSEDFV